MQQKSALFLLLLACSQMSFAACYTPACKDAEAQYASDKKLCAGEASSSARMQCQRDAKAEYDRAMAQANPAPAPVNQSRAAAACPDCGSVTSVKIVEKKGEGGAVGMIGGGIAGALLGNQIGRGTGKTVATVAGAAGGAYAGKKIEENVRSTKVWSVRVRMDSGEDRVFEYEQDPGVTIGTPVRVSGNSLYRR